MTTKNIILAATALMTICACTSDKDKEEIENTARDFASCYFGCHFDEAIKLCDKESRKWIVFTATNISDDDLTVLNSSETMPQYDVKDVSVDNDSTATAIVEAKDYMRASDIDTTAVISQEDIYAFKLRKRGVKWLVSLDMVPTPTNK